MNALAAEIDFALLCETLSARFRLGEAQLALNQREEARRTWQDLIAAHADAKNDHIPEATFNLSATYGLPSPANKEDLSLGVASLESFLKKYPDHKLAPQAHLRIAQSQLNFGRNADAVKALDVVSFAATAGVMIATAFFASLIPALRALRIDPINALRGE